MQTKTKSKEKIVKRLLTVWQAEAAADLKDIPYAQIAEKIGRSRQIVTNYLTLSKQKSFDKEIIDKINEYRLAIKDLPRSFTLNTKTDDGN